MSRMKEDKDMLLYYQKLANIPHKNKHLKKYHKKERKQERKKMKLKNNFFGMIGNEYLINHEDSQDLHVIDVIL